MPRRRPRYSTPAHRHGSPFLAGSGGGFAVGRRPRRNWPRTVLVVLIVAAVAGAIVAGVVLWREHEDAKGDRRDAAQKFTRAWAKGDYAAMWDELTPAARQKHSRAAFAAAYRRAAREATQRGVRVGRPASERDGRIAVPVAVATRHFRTLRGTVALPVSGSGEDAGVDWDASLRLPGLRKGETVSRRAGTPPDPGTVLAADGTPLDAIPIGATIAKGLEKQFAARLDGHAAERLLFGRRVVARAPRVRGRSVRTTLQPRSAASSAASW
jgi:peptidoglycan glycosyltransferase